MYQTLSQVHFRYCNYACDASVGSAESQVHSLVHSCRIWHGDCRVQRLVQLQLEAWNHCIITQENTARRKQFKSVCNEMTNNCSETRSLSQLNAWLSIEALHASQSARHSKYKLTDLQYPWTQGGATCDNFQYNADALSLVAAVHLGHLWNTASSRLLVKLRLHKKHLVAFRIVLFRNSSDTANHLTHK